MPLNIETDNYLFQPSLLMLFIFCYETDNLVVGEGPRDASCQLKSCQLPRNRAETTYTTSPDQIDDMKLEI